MIKTQLTRSALIFAFAAIGASAQNTFPSSGNVGIGTTTPMVLGGGNGLEVSGNGANTILRISDNNNNTYMLGLTTSASGYSTIQSEHAGVAYTPLTLNPHGGNVGIGTTSPSASLDVQRGAIQIGSNATPEPLLLGGKHLIFFNNDWATVTAGSIIGGLGFFGPGASHGQFDYRAAKGFELLDVSADGPSSTHPATTYAPLYVSSMYTTGNLGVGTVSPAEKLEVSGNLKLSGSGSHIHFVDGTDQSTAWTGTLTGGDYAESMDVTGSREQYEPGDVLVLDPEHPGKVIKSVEGYSLAVAGVYSTKPGLVGRRQKIAKELATTEVPMAMVGVVPTKVTAENGPIRPGDVLVTSSKAGYAMKGTDRTLFAGAVIGKAMGTLDSGTGMVEALISLQ